jgi:hypothetical protein
VRTLCDFGISVGNRLAVPFKGPVLIAIYGFTSVLAIAAMGDAKVVLSGGISGAPRIARHLWRMCLGLTLALGSFFTNALPHLLPGPVHVTALLLFPSGAGARLPDLLDRPRAVNGLASNVTPSNAFFVSI